MSQQQQPPPLSQPPTATSTGGGGATTMMNMSIKHRFSQMINDYWTKNNDFVPLQDAGTMINQALRSDEEDADLYRKIASQGGTGTSSSSTSSSASHLYFPYDPKSTENSSNTHQMNGVSSPSPGGTSVPTAPPPPDQTLEHIQSIPLPTLLSDQLQKVRMYSSMGLLRPSSSHLAYMTVDHQLYVWSYEDQIASFPDEDMTTTMATNNTSLSSSIISFSIPSGQCIISVGLVRPKKGKS
jgi:Nup133 N terminal like